MRKEIEIQNSNDIQSAENNQEIKRNKRVAKKARLWTHFQNLIYIRFLEENFRVFESEELRKSKKVFSTLSKILKSRQTCQIKSHHQKMMKKFKSLSQIIQGMKLLISQPEKSVKEVEQHLQLQSNHDFFEDSYQFGKRQTDFFFNEESNNFPIFMNESQELF